MESAGTNKFCLLSKDRKKELQKQQNNDKKINQKQHIPNKKKQTNKKVSVKNDVSSDDNVVINKNKHVDSTAIMNKIAELEFAATMSKTVELGITTFSKKIVAPVPFTMKITTLPVPEDVTDEHQKIIIGDKTGDTMFLNSQWTVWVHRNDCDDWTESSYKCIYVINSVGAFWKFFNNFHLLNKENNQFFIMRDKIKPIWEDNSNRGGGICSIKLDCYDRNSSIDIGTEAMMCYSLLMMNESLITNGLEINGISYSIKMKSVLIKIWTKNYKYDIETKLPKNLISRFNAIIKCNISSKKFDNYVNMRYIEIKPEYEV